MSEAVDLVVVGAGPAGAAAAITASRAGASVVVIDKARFPRDKCCGDGLTTPALRELEALGFDPSGLPSFVRTPELLVRSASGRRAVLPLTDSRGVAAAVCRRIELDAALVALARQAGARVTEGEAFVGLEVLSDGVEIELSGGKRLRASQVIAADGAWSPVRRALDADGARGEPLHWHAYRAYYSGVSAAAASQLFVAFEDELLPGYAWSFPLGDGGANVGVCLTRTTRRLGADLARLCEETLVGDALTSFLGAEARREGTVRSWPIPAPVGALPLSGAGGRVLFVGDAARAADPFSGEGIGQALMTGRSAGEAVVRGGGASAVALAYRDLVGRHLLPDQRIASWANRAMRHRVASRGAVRLAAAHPRIAHGIGRWLYEDYPRPDLYRPWRWGRVLRPRPLPFSERV